MTAAMSGALLATLAPVAAQAQLSRSGVQPPPAMQSGPGDHRIRYMLGGAAVGSAMALGYYFMSNKGENAGRCGPTACALPYLSISGGLFGLFLSREKAAQRRAEMPRAGEALEFPLTSVTLPAAATSIAVRDTIVVAATDSGAQVVQAATRPVVLRRRGAGLSSVRSVAIGGADPRLYIGTGTALWETPLTSGLLTRVSDGAVDALDASGDVIVSATDRTLRVRRTVNGATRVDSVQAPSAVSAIAPESAERWWVTADSALLSLTFDASGAPSLTHRATFAGQALAVTSSPTWVVVSLGGDGLAIWPRTALAGSSAGGVVIAPTVMRGEPRYAFDAAFVGERLFVAGGVDGVVEVDLSGAPRVVGASRQAGYATSISSEGGVLWVSDRGSNRVLRITP